MEPHFSEDWFSHNIPVWESVLFPRFKDRPNVRGLEIGCFEGRASCWLLQHVLTHPTARLICIDPFSGEKEYDNDPCGDNEQYTDSLRLQRNLAPLEETFDHNIRAIGAEPRVIKHKGVSADVLRTLPLQSCDLVYIDASHIAMNVLRDIILSWDLLRRNGIMILDDYEWNVFANEPLRNPAAAINAFLYVFAGQYIILREGYQIILEKMNALRPLVPPVVPIVDYSAAASTERETP